MPMKQLNTLYKYEYEKEQKSAQQLQKAELEYRQNIERLQSVSDYRLEYMKRLNERSEAGIDSATFRQFHAFMIKLDHASGQVRVAMVQAKALMKKSKEQWLIQRQKVQAVEILQKKKIQAMQKIENRREQNMFDEIATQQFIRRKQQS